MIARMAVVTRNLVKRYGRRRALDGFSLAVPEGCVLGLVGANGAGKTTWMMSVAGLVRTDGGEIDLLERGPFDAQVHSGRVAILPQDSDLPLETTAEGFLVGLGRLQGLSVAKAQDEAHRVLAAVNLTDRAKASVRSLSHGMRKRLMAAQCFLGNPELILLDEPMDGLDPEEAVRMRSLILGGSRKRTLIISSHDLSGLERICTHIAFVESGRVVRFAPLAELTADGVSLEEAYLNRRNIRQSG